MAGAVSRSGSRFFERRCLIIMQRFVFSRGLAPFSFPFPGGEARLRAEGGALVLSLPYRAAFGGGERFDGVNLKGRTVRNRVEEKFCHQGDYTYCPIPFFLTDTGFGLFLETDAESTFSFGETISVTLPEQTPVVLFSGMPLEILRTFLSYTGPAALPPKWAFGPWISANRWHSQRDAEKAIAALEKYHFPASVLVLEAWSDEATFYIFHGARYAQKPAGEPLVLSDFDFSESAYWQDPKAFVDALHKKGIHLVLWQIPALKALGPGDSPSARHEADCTFAIERELCLKNPDGTPYRIPEGHWFAGSLVPDFSNPVLCDWWFQNRQYLLDLGVDGFKTDGGEFIYDGAVRAFDGRDGKALKNAYAQSYVAAYRRFAGESRVLFSRAGYTGQHTTPILWAGDQKSENAELRSVLRAGLSAAASGVLFWGFDIAGFSGPLPSADLYRRATQFACFCPVMQWHSEPDGGQFGGEDGAENNERSPWNLAQYTENPEAFLSDIRFWHRLRRNLLPYLSAEAKKCVRDGRPMMAPLGLFWPEEYALLSCEDAYLFGESLLCCPVLEPNAKTRGVPLPPGEWVELFSRERVEGAQTRTCSAAPAMPVFLRAGKALVLELGREEVLGGPVSSEDAPLLTFLLAGQKGRYEFLDESGALTISWENGAYCTDGAISSPYRVLFFPAESPEISSH